MERNLTVANWLFAQTTHVVAAPYGFACVVMSRNSYIYSNFYGNLFKGFGATGCRTLPSPIDLVSGFVTAYTTVHLYKS